MKSGSDFIGGLLIGLLATALFATTIRDKGRSECEETLKRSEKCVQQWVPEKAQRAQAQKGQA